jgi:cardiolipin synthase A/B
VTSKSEELAWTRALQERLQVMGATAPIRCERPPRILQDAEFFDVLWKAMDDAEFSIDGSTFAWGTGEPSRLTAQKSVDAKRRGVRVRWLMDAIGSAKRDKGDVGAMKDASVEVRDFRSKGSILKKAKFYDDPIGDTPSYNEPENARYGPDRAASIFPPWSEYNYRYHGKIIVIDRGMQDAVVFSGGHNPDRKWYEGLPGKPTRRDFTLMYSGKEVAEAFGKALDQAWAGEPAPLSVQRERIPAKTPNPAFTLDPLDPSGTEVQVLRSSGGPRWTREADAVIELLSFARESVDIATAYFSPTPPVMAALKNATGHGVKVRLLLNGEQADQWYAQMAGRVYYDTLQDMPNLQIGEYDESMLHSKLMIVDGKVAKTGTGNWNMRSQQLDDEEAVFNYGSATVKPLQKLFDDYWAKVRHITRDDLSPEPSLRERVFTGLHLETVL